MAKHPWPQFRAQPRPSVPIVGQPFTVHEPLVVATVQCTCHPANQPFLIPGTDAAKICRGCGNVYAITRIEYQRQPHQGAPARVEVSIIGNQKAQISAAPHQHERPQTPPPTDAPALTGPLESAPSLLSEKEL